MPAMCTYIKQDGSRCGKPARAESEAGMCWNHDPANMGEPSAIKPNPHALVMGKLEHLEADTEWIMGRLRVGDITHPVATVLLQGARVRMSVIQLMGEIERGEEERCETRGEVYEPYLTDTDPTHDRHDSVEVIDGASGSLDYLFHASPTGSQRAIEGS